MPSPGPMEMVPTTTPLSTNSGVTAKRLNSSVLKPRPTGMAPRLSRRSLVPERPSVPVKPVPSPPVAPTPKLRVASPPRPRSYPRLFSATLTRRQPRSKQMSSAKTMPPRPFSASPTSPVMTRKIWPSKNASGGPPPLQSCTCPLRLGMNPTPLPSVAGRTPLPFP